jgi:hypothetical protein
MMKNQGVYSTGSSKTPASPNSNKKDPLGGLNEIAKFKINSSSKSMKCKYIKFTCQMSNAEGYR